MIEKYSTFYCIIYTYKLQSECRKEAHTKYVPARIAYVMSEILYCFFYQINLQLLLYTNILQSQYCFYTNLYI